MTQVKIKKTITGNCGCYNCGKRQVGLAPQPYTVWYKLDGDKRGTNAPMCSKECAEKFAKNVVPTIKRMNVADIM